MKIVPIVGAGVALAYYVYRSYSKGGGCGVGRVNPNVKKDCPKVVDMIDIEDIKEKAPFCRCWRSKKVSNI